MSRLVEVKTWGKAGPEFAAAPSTGQSIKDYAERVAKYVPAEVIAVYTAAVQLVLAKQGADNADFRLWAFVIIAVIALIGTPLYLGRLAKNPKERIANQAMATVAFVVWAYSYPAGWAVELGWHDPVVAGLLLLGFTFASGFYQPVEGQPAAGRPG